LHETTVVSAKVKSQAEYGSLIGYLLKSRYALLQRIEIEASFMMFLLLFVFKLEN